MKVFVLALVSWFATTSQARSDFAKVTPEEYYYASVRLDTLLHDNPPSSARLVELNAAIDSATKLYRDKKQIEAIRALNDVAITLLPEDADKDSYRVVWSLAVELSPPNLTLASADAAIVFRSMYPVKVSSPTTFWTDLAAEGTPLLQTKPTLRTMNVPESGPAMLSLPLKETFGGQTNLVLNLSYSADELTETRRYLVPGADPDSFMKQYLNRLEKIKDVKGVDPGYDRARRIAAERVKLLDGVHSTTNSARFLIESKTFQRSLYHEFKLLTSGINPYRNEPGDIWRPVILAEPSKGPIRCRVYVPSFLPARKDGAPLLVVLSDEEGDENSFFDAYGKGEIKRLADELHFVLASPNVHDVARGTKLAELIDQIAEDQKVDRSRVYVLGHGTGAEFAAACAGDSAGQVAAVACFCAGEFHVSPSSKPVQTLAYGGKLDSVTPAKEFSERIEKATLAGFPIEFHMVENQGHSMIVLAKMREAAEWLLMHAQTATK